MYLILFVSVSVSSGAWYNDVPDNFFENLDSSMLVNTNSNWCWSNIWNAFLHCLAARQCGRMAFTEATLVAASETLDLEVLRELWAFQYASFLCMTFILHFHVHWSKKIMAFIKNFKFCFFFGMDCCVVSYQILSVLTAWLYFVHFQ